MADAQDGHLGDRVFLIVGTIIATGLARRAVNMGWVAFTGKQAPLNPDDPQVRTRNAVVFALTTGALAGVARLLVSRTAQRRIHRREVSA